MGAMTLRRFTTGLVASLLLAAPLQAQFLDFEFSSYRGGDEVLLRSPVGPFTERDLFMYALLNRAIPIPDVMQWRDLQGKRAERLLDVLEDMVRSRMINRDARGHVGDVDPGFLERGARIIAGPAAEWLWADTVVRQSVRIFPEDVMFYYLQNLSEFGQPETVLLRRVQIAFPITATIETQNRARARAEELRREALELGSLQPLLERDSALLVDPPGELFELVAGDNGVDPQIADIGFRMVPGQISPVFRAAGGFFILECVERIEEDVVSVLRVREEIIEKLNQRFLPLQFEYLAARRMGEALPFNRSRIFANLPSDADIFSVRRFRLTRAEFERMFSFAPGPDPDAPNLVAISFLVERAILSEVITQDLERRGLLRDPFYQEVLQEARRSMDGTVFIQDQQVALVPSDEDLERIIEERGAEIAPIDSKVVWRLELSPRNRERLSPTEVDTLRIQMLNNATTVVNETTRLLDERAAIGGERAYADPLAAFNRVTRPDSLRIDTRLVFSGIVLPGEATDILEVPYEELQFGRFTAPRARRDGTVVSFYTSDVLDAPELDEDTLLERARQLFIDETVMRVYNDQIDLMRQARGFSFHEDFPLDEATQRLRLRPRRLIDPEKTTTD